MGLNMNRIKDRIMVLILLCFWIALGVCFAYMGCRLIVGTEFLVEGVFATQLGVIIVYYTWKCYRGRNHQEPEETVDPLTERLAQEQAEHALNGWLMIFVGVLYFGCTGIIAIVLGHWLFGAVYFLIGVFLVCGGLGCYYQPLKTRQLHADAPGWRYLSLNQKHVAGVSSHVGLVSGLFISGIGCAAMISGNISGFSGVVWGVFLLCIGIKFYFESR